MSKQRYVLLAFIAGAILVGLTVEAALVSAFAQLGMVDERLFGLVNTSTALSVVSGLVSFFVLIRNRRALGFTGEVVGELLEVTWPTREETTRASTTVVLTTLFTAALLAIYDFTWKNLADFVLFTER